MIGSHKVNQAFSLIELMIVVVIIGAALALAIPNLMAFVRDARVDDETQNLFAALNQARQLAMTQRRATFLCRTDDPVSEECTASGDSDQWNRAKLMYSSVVGATLPNPGSTLESYRIQSVNGSASLSSLRGEESPVLRQLPETIGTLTVVLSENHEVIGFSSQGNLLHDGTLRLAICDDRSPPEDHGKVIEINPIGRLKVYPTGTESGQVDCEAQVNN